MLEKKKNKTKKQDISYIFSRTIAKRENKRQCKECRLAYLQLLMLRALSRFKPLEYQDYMWLGNISITIIYNILI